MQLDSDDDDHSSSSSESDMSGSDGEFVPENAKSRAGSENMKERTSARRCVQKREIPTMSAPSLVRNERASDNEGSDADSLRQRIRHALSAKGEADGSSDVDGKSPAQSPATVSTTTVTSSKNLKAVTSAAKAAYLKSLQNATQKRSFPLSKIPKHQTIATGRTIKPLRAWKGHWPALREFMQNTIDHLGLMDGKTGRRRSEIDLHVEKGGENNAGKSTLATFRFTCGDEDICTITAAQDELIISQLYTFPIASRALDTGVPDTTKGMASSNQAGGFGDGFKTAAVALLASTKEFTSLKWYFDAKPEDTNIVWTFEGLTRQSIGTFAKCQVLQVQIDRVDGTDAKENRGNGDTKARKGNSAIKGRECAMRQVIKVKGIGKSFVEQAVPRLVVFWDVDNASVLNTTGNGGDFIGSSLDQPPLFNGVLGSLKPESGIYVRGIWVRTSKIANTCMCFFGNRLQVTGRDRNDVDEDELVDAFVHLFRKCGNLAYLRQLLEPLRGQHAANDAADMLEDSGGGGRRKGTRANASSGGSWLLQSPRFLNRVIEQQKDFILHNVLDVPRGAIFVSSKTTKSNDPFIKWAAGFLKSHGAPLVPIEKGANRYLFEEVSESELTDRCVRILKGSLREGGAKALHAGFKKLMTFMGLGRAKVFFSSEIAVAFCYDRSIFVPEATLTRELVVRVLNVCHSHLEGASDDSYSCLMQAIFETLPAGGTRQLEIADLTKAVGRAKSVQKETREFMANPTAATISEASSGKRVAASKSPAGDSFTVEDLTDDTPHGSSGGGAVRGGDLVPTTAADLMKQIQKTNQLNKKGSKKRKQGCCGSDDHLDPLIPATDFEDDNAGEDSCIRPTSSLQDVAVDASLGGGSMLCDANSASDLQNGNLSAALRLDVLSLRGHLQTAMDIVRKSIPSLDQMLQRVRPGFDAANDDYEAFCDGTHIVVNLHTFRAKLRTTANDARTLIHDLVVVVTHELAHFLEPRAGHGPVWRDTHMRMLIEVMKRLENTH
jgi:hypothetical protein